MKRNSFSLILFFILLIGIIIAEDFSKLELTKGKNEITVNYSLGYASDLVKMYPQIETVTYIENNETIGYVNIFGGIGKDFIIQRDKLYEINSNKNITIYSR